MTETSFHSSISYSRESLIRFRSKNIMCIWAGRGGRRGVCVFLHICADVLTSTQTWSSSSVLFHSKLYLLRKFLTNPRDVYSC